MTKLKRKEIPAEVKAFLKDPNSFDHKSYWKSLAQQLKSKSWMSEKQVKIVADHLANPPVEEVTSE